MKRIFIIAIVNFSFFYCQSQNIEQIDIVRGSWVVLGDIDKVISNDTIVLRRVPDYMPGTSSYNRGYLYGLDVMISDLFFEKDGKIILNYYSVGYVPENRYKWRIDPKSQTINIDIVGKMKNKFKLVNSITKIEKCTAYIGNMNEKVFYDGEVNTIVLKKM